MMKLWVGILATDNEICCTPAPKLPPPQLNKYQKTSLLYEQPCKTKPQLLIFPLTRYPMALKPTIYKLRTTISDSDRNFYDTTSLTIAQHPSENLERVMARTLAYVLNMEENLAFTKGLSAVEEPDIWLRTLDDRLSLWIDIGEPNTDRIRKASRQSPRVKIYTFNTKSDTWWSQSEPKLSELNVSVYQFEYSEIEALARLIKRSMDISFTITGGTIYVSATTGDCEVSWKTLQDRENS